MMTDNVNLMNGDEQTASSLSEDTPKNAPSKPRVTEEFPLLVNS